jgi:cell division septum initiation protein DivIVA
MEPGHASDPFGARELAELEDRRRTLEQGRRGGYEIAAVDAFLDEAVDSIRSLIDENAALRAGTDPDALWGGRWGRARMSAGDVRDVTFPLAPPLRLGYRMRPVDELLEAMSFALARLHSENERLRE